MKFKMFVDVSIDVEVNDENITPEKIADAIDSCIHGAITNDLEVHHNLWVKMIPPYNKNGLYSATFYLDEVHVSGWETNEENL